VLCSAMTVTLRIRQLMIEERSSHLCMNIFHSSTFNLRLLLTCYYHPLTPDSRITTPAVFVGGSRRNFEKIELYLIDLGGWGMGYFVSHDCV
jgi:hypothetical protein